MKVNSVHILLDQVLSQKYIADEKKLLTLISKLPDFLKDDKKLMSYLSCWFEKILILWKRENLSTQIIEFCSDLLSILIKHGLLFSASSGFFNEFTELYAKSYYEHKHNDTILFLTKYIEQQKLLLEMKQTKVIIDSGSWKLPVELIINECCDPSTFLYSEVLLYISELFCSCDDVNTYMDIIKFLDPNKIISNSGSINIYRLDMLYSLLTSRCTDFQIYKLNNEYPIIKCLKNQLATAAYRVSCKISFILLTCYYADFIIKYSKIEDAVMFSKYLKNIMKILSISLQNGHHKLIHEVSQVFISRLLTFPSGNIVLCLINYMLHIMTVPVVKCAIYKIERSDLSFVNFSQIYYQHMTTHMTTYVKSIAEEVIEFSEYYEKCLSKTKYEYVLEIVNLIPSTRYVLHKIYDENKIYLLKTFSALFSGAIKSCRGNLCNQSSIVISCILNVLNCLFKQDNFNSCHMENITILENALHLLQRHQSICMKKQHMEAFTLLRYVLPKMQLTNIEPDLKLLLSDVLVQKLDSANWKIRDGALECVGIIVTIYYEKGITNDPCLIMNAKLIDSIVAMTADNERFIRYTVYSTLTNIMQYTRCRKIPLSTDDLIDKTLKCYVVEEEGIVRERMVCLLYQLLANKAFRDKNQFLAMCNLMVYIAKKDLHPICVQHSLKFWNKIISVIFRRCNRLTMKHMKFLSSLGYLQILVDITSLEYDETLIKCALQMIKKLLLISDVKYDDHNRKGDESNKKLRRTTEIRENENVHCSFLKSDTDLIRKLIACSSSSTGEKRDSVISSILKTDDITLLPALMAPYDDRDNNRSKIDLSISPGPRISVENFLSYVHRIEISTMLKDYLPDDEVASSFVDFNIETDDQLYTFLTELIDKDFYDENNRIDGGRADKNIIYDKSLLDDRNDKREENDFLLVQGRLSPNKQDESAENRNSSDSESEKEFDILDCY